ncbi:MAG: glycogen synthase GlgA [Kiritimatiellae bacterium]|nr:glycogen synthase GlgA [Kiritimatiellia bacterium]MDW8458977.1 glycogen synthase GlgA [Verrucomicrobiota bacterium]
MKIAYVSSEISPFASTGGLGEVAGALPVALAKLGHTVHRFMPCYRTVLEKASRFNREDLRVTVPVGMKQYTAEFLTVNDRGVITWFVRRDEFFDRSQLYNLPERDYEDNFERFVFFQKAVIALIDRLNLAPDVIHLNDWQTGMIPYFLEHGIQGKRRGRREKCMFTIHNIAYQGIYPDADYALTNLPFSAYSVNTFEYYGKINCMKAGITGSDAVTTVSPGYAREILTPEGGFGLDGLLRSVKDRLFGVLNGIDVEVWNPATDPHLPAPYTSSDLKGKAACRRSLAAKMGVLVGEKTKIVGMVSRLVDMKGLDIVAEALPGMMERDLVFVLLGSGEKKYEDLARSWAETFKGRVGVLIGYNAPLSHLITAGSDFMLIPSKSEPCGLTQMYSQRYGTVPIVHSVGGLSDSIRDPDESSEPTGFKFREYTATALLRALDRALEWHKTTKRLELARRMMGLDLSWEKAAKQYLDLYHRIGAPN